MGKNAITITRDHQTDPQHSFDPKCCVDNALYACQDSTLARRFAIVSIPAFHPLLRLLATRSEACKGRPVR